MDPYTNYSYNYLPRAGKFLFSLFFTAYNKIILQHSKFLGDGNELALCNNSIPDLADFFNDIECMKNEIKWKC